MVRQDEEQLSIYPHHLSAIILLLVHLHSLYAVLIVLAYEVDQRAIGAPLGNPGSIGIVGKMMQLCTVQSPPSAQKNR
jgi:hypothetical protein